VVAILEKSLSPHPEASIRLTPTTHLNEGDDQ
jgi:hypothetical protein